MCEYFHIDQLCGVPIAYLICCTHAQPIHVTESIQRLWCMRSTVLGHRFILPVLESLRKAPKDQNGIVANACSPTVSPLFAQNVVPVLTVLCTCRMHADK